MFERREGREAPDADGLVAALPALSLTADHRYLLADGVERWSAAEAKRVAAALGALPEGTTVVLIAHGKPPAVLAKAVKGAGGEALAYEAPRERQLPRLLAAEAQKRGYELESEAARLLVDRLGPNPLRLANELDRLALWAEGGRVGRADLEAMLADTSESAVWSLSDAIASGDAAAAMRVAERLIAQGESVTRLVYSLAARLRQAARAAAELESGRSPKEVADGLSMHPYAAKMLVSRVGGRDPAELRGAVEAIADLEVWLRGGADYPEGVALTLALRRAAGAAGEGEPLAA